MVSRTVQYQSSLRPFSIILSRVFWKRVENKFLCPLTFFRLIRFPLNLPLLLIQLQFIYLSIITCFSDYWCFSTKCIQCTQDRGQKGRNSLFIGVGTRHFRLLDSWDLFGLLHCLWTVIKLYDAYTTHQGLIPWSPFKTSPNLVPGSQYW